MLYRQITVYVPFSSLPRSIHLSIYPPPSPLSYRRILSLPRPVPLSVPFHSPLLSCPILLSAAPIPLSPPSRTPSRNLYTFPLKLIYISFDRYIHLAREVYTFRDDRRRGCEEGREKMRKRLGGCFALDQRS